jgi:tetratricopeptide (TPR) repeat protein
MQAEDELRELARRSSQLAKADDWGEEALRVNARIVELRPGAEGALMRLANCQWKTGDGQAAEDAYRQVLSLGKDATHVKIAQRRLGEIGEIRRAAECTSSTEARQQAIWFRDQGAIERARPWFRRAVEVAHDDAERTSAFSAWVSMLRSARQFEAALGLLRESIAAEPSRRSNKASYTALVATLVDLGRLDEAMSEGPQLLKLHPDDPHVLNACGRLFQAVYKQTGNPSFKQRADACFARLAGSPPSTRA